jgi:hypothetical protein
MTQHESPLEQRLEAALIGLRPAEGAPASLRYRVHEVSSAGVRPSMLGGFGRWLVVSGSIAVLAVAGLIAVRGGLVAPPPVTPGAPGTGIDPTVEGPGVVTSMIATLPIAGWAIAAVLAMIAVLILRPDRRQAGSLVMAGAVGAAAVGAAWLAGHPGPQVGGWNGYGPVIGFWNHETPSAPGPDGVELRTLYVSARPGEPFAFNFVVHNPGPLAVRLEGIREDPDANTRIAPRWTALALGTDQDAIGQPPSGLVRFVPVEILPDGDLTLYVIGKASACAVGPGPYGTDQAFAGRGPDIELVYSVFGLTDVSTYTMPMLIWEPIRNGCPG